MRTSFTTQQLTDPQTSESERILRRCVHCGFCTATCPTYVLLGDELDSPRGRIYLIKEMLENARPASAQLVEHVDRCLSCLSCMTTCPSGVNYQHLVDHARAHIERTYQRPWDERALRFALAHVLPYPWRMRVALLAARVCGGIARLLPSSRRAPSSAAASSLGALLGLAGRIRHHHRAAPAVATPAGAQPHARVALLEGCVQSVIAPQIHTAALRVLARAGIEVVTIKGCCGALVHHLGRERHARHLAAGLLRRLERERRRGLDAIVVTASGCGMHLKDYGFAFRSDAEIAAPAAAMSGLARDITEVLADPALCAVESTPPATSRVRGERVAYHSACSLQHAQQVERAPRLLLERAGFHVEEIPEGHLCCGSAGTYNILQPKIAGELRERKLANIRGTSAGLVAAGNIGCIVQLASSEGPRTVHTVELLDWAAGGPDPR